MASSTGQFLSRTDHKKARELEEARKAGTLPAELDEEVRPPPRSPAAAARAGRRACARALAFRRRARARAVA
jgi:hypothetical protein